MANSNSDSIFSWDAMWAAFQLQEPEIQDEWWFGLDYKSYGQGKKPIELKQDGLKDVLTRICKTKSNRIMDDVFESAPDEIKQYFHYGESQRKFYDDIPVYSRIQAIEKLKRLK